MEQFGACSEKAEVVLCAILLVALYSLDLITATSSAESHTYVEKPRLVPMAQKREKAELRLTQGEAERAVLKTGASRSASFHVSN